jgi:DNA-directed RNA polymerase
MLDGRKTKYERLKAVQGRAIAHNRASLCLPVYRSLVSKNTELLAPKIANFVEHHKKRRGRPGNNAIASAYIEDLGPRMCAALALSLTVNHFHRPMTFQSLAMKIGLEVANEWVLSQEDPNLIERINKYRYGNVGTQRKYDYLRKTLKDIRGVSLRTIPTEARAAIGNVLLGFIVKTPLVECSTQGKKSLLTIVASKHVLDYLDNSIHRSADLHSIHYPRFDYTPAGQHHLVKPQRGRYKAESTISSDDSDIVVAANALNETGWTINKAQFEAIKYFASWRSPVLGLPYIFEKEFPRFTHDMEESRIKDIKKARALLYAERNKNAAKRARLMSGLSVLQHFVDKTVYFETEADFRGRLYLNSELVSYQGPDWLRSLWEFSEGVAIENEEQRDWLFIHAANCYGHNRVSYSDRVAFVQQNLHKIHKVCDNTRQSIDFLEEASDPLRFLAACREVSQFMRHGYGYKSKLPIQMDATSQGIQIWSALTNDKDLMYASNVLPNDEGTPRDVYVEFADIVNHIALTSPAEEAAYFRRHPIDRKLAKSVLMVLPYGGTMHGLLDIVNTKDWKPSVRARVWLARTLWEQACDILHEPMKAQHRASQAVREAFKDDPNMTHYEWELPNGLTVRQRYMIDKRVRIKNSIGSTIHQYRVETDTRNVTKSAVAFPPNLIHSIDSCILCLSLKKLKHNNNIKHFMAIHDCVGVHAAHAPAAQKALKEAFRETLTHPMVLEILQKTSCNGLYGPYNGPLALKEASTLSQYLFS